MNVFRTTVLRTTVLLAAGLVAAAPLAAQDVTLCVQNILGNRSVWLSADAMEQRWRALDGSFFIERTNGTASYIGAIENVGDPNKRFSVRMDYTGRVNPGDIGYPPAGSPRTNDFINNNLISVGGIIDLNTWHYYTGMTGTFTGQIDYAGAVLSVSRRGPSFQVGIGANEKDLAFGASGWFFVNVVSPPTTGVSLPTSFDHGDTNTAFGNNCVCFGGQQASRRNYGVGLAGCNGVPMVSMPALPLTGTNPRITIGNAGATPSTCAMVWGIAPANTFNQQLGGTLLVASPFAAVVTVTVPPGGFNFDCTIPDDGCQVGSQLYLQVVCIDTCAAAGFSLSDGLEVIVGDL